MSSTDTSSTDTTVAPTASPSAAPPGFGSRGLPIALFSIPLGLAGLGGAWAAAAQLLGASAVPADLAYGASAVVWAIFTGTYVLGTMRHDIGKFGVDFRHPLFGPLTSYIPVVAILLIGYYAPDLGSTARWLMFVAVAALAVNAAALVAAWLSRPLDRDAMHPGYFLPVVAGPFIASIGLASVGEMAGSVGAFGIGIYFWLLLGAVISARLFFGTPLPQPFKPALSILMSPPATACLAWLMIRNGDIDDLQIALGGVTMFMLSIQLFFLPDYLRLPFSSQHWVFTFPLAVLGNIGVRWAVGSGSSSGEPIAWCVLTVSTASISAILLCSLLGLVRRLRLALGDRDPSKGS